MSAVPFDTLKLARDLRDRAHFTQEQAEGAVSALADAFQDQVATKSNIAILQAELAVIKWLMGGIGFGVLLLIIKSFWPVH